MARPSYPNSKEILVQIQVEESQRTGIPNLKIGFNNVFGHYLEVTNKYKNQGLIPESWTRKQTTTNGERYITAELKKQESCDSAEWISGKEAELYEQLVDQIQPHRTDPAKCSTAGRAGCPARLWKAGQETPVCLSGDQRRNKD
ncbi:MAG: hypothetical protein R2787_12345 [Saprospiraceae bacterium]